MSIGLEPLTARFEVQILGEELFNLVRRIYRQYIAFLIPFYPPAGIEPRTPGLTCPPVMKMGMFYKGIITLLDLYIIPIRMLWKYSC
jgi:hypothetical protein